MSLIGSIVEVSESLLCALWVTSSAVCLPQLRVNQGNAALLSFQMRKISCVSPPASTKSLEQGSSLHLPWHGMQQGTGKARKHALSHGLPFGSSYCQAGTGNEGWFLISCSERWADVPCPSHLLHFTHIQIISSGTSAIREDTLAQPHVTHRWILDEFLSMVTKQLWSMWSMFFLTFWTRRNLQLITAVSFIVRFSSSSFLKQLNLPALGRLHPCLCCKEKASGSLPSLAVF